jgi:hypothetical protein
LCQYLHNAVVGKDTVILRENTLEPSSASGELLEAVRAASTVNAAAQRALNARRWVPGPAEKRVARDLGQAAVRPPVPLAKEGLRKELDVLACWAPLIRLAVAAGGWELPESPPAGPGPDAAMSLPVLLEAVYRPAQLLRRWQSQAPSWLRYPVGRDSEIDAALEDRFPGAGGCLQAADDLFWGLAGGVVVTLYVASGAGDPDY